MDNRLFNLTNQRPVESRKSDLMRLSRALVALFRGNAHYKVGYAKNLGYVHIQGLGVDVQILASDWAKIEPVIKDGTLSREMSKKRAIYSQPNISRDVSGEDQPYVQAMYHTLYLIFT